MTAQTSAPHSDRDLPALLQELCDLHNAMEGKPGGYDCPVCRNKGVVYKLDGLREVAQMCKCVPVRESIRRMKRSGLYDKLQSKTFDAFRTDEAWQQALLDAAKQFAETHDRPGFFIGGQPGCGKTHLCTAICASLLRQGFDVQYFVWETYVKDILSRSGNSDRDERERLLHPLYRADAVYLDDFLRKENPTQAERSVAFDVVNRRYADGRITVVSSENVMARLMATDPAIASRIKEMCGDAYCLNVAADSGKNYRMRS